MFRKIKEFIMAFKDAYNTINVNKFAAKKAIDDFKKVADDIIYIADSLLIIFSRLEDIYMGFPIKERQDFIRKTMDLLRYGRIDINGEFEDCCGLWALYKAQKDCVNIKLDDLNKLYKKSKYDEVVSLAEKYNEQLNEFYVLYGIKENPSKNNG